MMQSDWFRQLVGGEWPNEVAFLHAIVIAIESMVDAQTNLSKQLYGSYCCCCCCLRRVGLM